MKYILIILIVLLLLFICFISIISIKKNKFDDKKNICFHSKADTLSQTKLKIITWNIGYAGLDNKMDFFYDGGKKVRTTKKAFTNNLNQITNFFSNNKETDFFLLQEVDIYSKRSFFLNQLNTITKAIPEYHFGYAKNYDVPFVPVPLFNPLGIVKSGLLNISKEIPLKTVRYSLPGQYHWPKYLFMPDRCFLISRYPLKSGKQLLIINIHNSAYDDGNLKKAQLNFLLDFFIKEYQKGNYVIAGGDWNQPPFNFNKYTPKTLNSQTTPNKWQFAYDSSTPTNRKLNEPFNNTSTLTTIIDYFILSPNIICDSVHTYNMNFKYSDHHPVEITCRLK